MPHLPRYRYRTRALVGPWRNSRERAIDDAVRAKQAKLDDHEPRGFRWLVPGQIDEEKDEQPPEPVRRAIGR
jgi:hypothetical protein